MEEKINKEKCIARKKYGNRQIVKVLGGVGGYDEMKPLAQNGTLKNWIKMVKRLMTENKFCVNYTLFQKNSVFQKQFS